MTQHIIPYREYWHAGFTIIPLHGKIPIHKNWQDTKYQGEDELREIEQKQGNFGVLCIGWLVIDVDAKNGGIESLHKLLLILPELNHAGFTVATGSGNGSKHIYYALPPSETQKLKTKHQEYPGIDFKSSGQVVGAGSIHPETKKIYEIERGSPANITVAPVRLIELLRYVEPQQLPPSPMPTQVFHNGDRTPQILAMLRCIPPDVGYEDWIRIGMGIHNETNGAGYQIWYTWSSQGAKFKATEMRSKWTSFHGGGVTFGTILSIAKSYGYVPTRLSCNNFHPITTEQPSIPSSPTTPKVTTKLTPYQAIQPENPPPQNYDIIPPFQHFTELVKLIVNTGPKKQPKLAVANLLAALGVLMGGKVATETDLRTNLYFCAVVGSGRGKDHSRKVITRLFRLLGLEKLCSLKLGTGPGVVKLMDSDPPSKLFMHDEFGLFLKMVGREQTAAPWREINEVLNDFFSVANDVYHSTATKGGGVLAIREPCLGVYATSTPDEFYSGLTKTMLSSGMLARVIFVMGDENATIELEPKKVAIPKNLLDHLKIIANLQPDFNTDPISGVPLKSVREIRFTYDARNEWNEFRVKMDHFVRSEDEFSSIYSRAGEHVAKIALILSSFELQEEISVDAVRWSTQYIESAINGLISALKENMAENLTEQYAKRILALIRRRGGSMTKSELVMNTKWLDKQTRDNLLISLAEGQELELEELASENSYKKTSIYKLR